MDYHIDSEQFFSVWKRVTDPGEPEAIPQNTERHEIEVLHGFITSETNNLECYIKLMKTPGLRSVHSTISKIADRKNSLLKKLKTSCFIMSGSIFNCVPQEPETTSVLDTLRSQYWLECDGADSYNKVLLGGCSEKLNNLYLHAVSEKHETAAALEGLIERLV